jgi:hypothetical protein
MSGTGAGSLLRRALIEHRRLVIPLALLLAVNVLVYVLYVRPLSQRVYNAASLTATAEAELTAGRLQHTQAHALLTGPARAKEELDTFYTKVLPGGFVEARKLPNPRLDQIAREAGIRARSRDSEVIRDPDELLTRLKIEMSVSGTYAGIRRFIYALEHAPEFVVVENVRITEEARDEDLLSVDLELSTFYREGP